jgi:LuxR family maltose regulon positive regulatory protein
MIQQLSYYLERPRIDRLLEAAIKNPIVTVCAGAGYGKTQAVYSFVRKTGARAAWLQLSEEDNESSRFWEKFTEAVSAINVGTASELTKIGFPETERQFTRYLEIPSADIFAAEEYFFVFDDMHLIQNSTVLEFIRRCITSPFPNITSMLISRTGLGLDLARIEERGQISHITETELQFTKDETTNYFRLLGMQPPAQTIAAVYNDTEGWAFAVNLAGLLLRHSRTEDIYIPQSLRSNVFRLIESEIVAGLSAEMRRFLIKLSLIEHLVPDLLREIAGAEKYRLIDEMEKIGSFIQYDAYRNAYRIHQLFLDCLRAKQDEISEAEKKQVWIQAAGWYVRNNRQMDAISYYEKAGDYTGLLAAIANLSLTLSTKTVTFIMRILDNMPPALIATSPTAAFLRPRMLATAGMFDRAEAEFKELISRLERSKVTGSDAMMILSLCYTSLGFIGMVTCLQSHDYSFTHYFKQGRHYAEISPYKLGPPHSVLNVGSYTCRAADPLEMENYNNMLTESVPDMAFSMNGCGYGMDDLARAELAFFKGDLNRAEQLANTTLEKANEQIQYEIAAFALFYLLRISMARGASSAIPDLLRQLDNCFEKPHFINRAVYRDLMYGFFYIQTGRLEETALWIKSTFEDSDFQSIVQGLEITVAAKYHFAQKRYPAALATLENREDKNGSTSVVLGRLEVTVLQAICRYRMDDFEGALHDLETAWELAKDNDLYMPFSELGKDMRALAGAALKAKPIKIPRTKLEKIRRDAAAYAKNVFAIAEHFRAASPEAKNKNAGGLSPRELAVLTGLSQGLTREEIARLSSISLNTVKSVTRSIYNKLGAVNKTDAVRIASQQRLL